MGDRGGEAGLVLPVRIRLKESFTGEVVFGQFLQSSVTSCLRGGQSTAKEPTYSIISLSLYVSLSPHPRILLKGRSWFSRAGVGPEILHSDKFR